MNHRRVLAVHDVSCVGRCSLTVALPIISSVGVECSGLPTAVLSTHTGGFTGYTYRDLTDDMTPVKEHWMSLGLRFDAIYTGFLGSFEQIDVVLGLFEDLRSEGMTVYVDPVMADAGRLYAVFGEDFPAGMRRLCERADVIMPNLTELCLMLGEEWRPGPYTREYIGSMLEKAGGLGVGRAVLTGVSFEEGSVGAVYRDFGTGEAGEVMRPEIPGYFHGTGDVFGSALVGACECGLSLADAVEAAVDLTVSSIRRTVARGADVRYGVDFEEGLRDYVSEVGSRMQGFDIAPVCDEVGLRLVASVAHSVWREAYEGIVPREQTLYMLDRFQSYEAVRGQVRDEGYTYLLIRKGDRPVGFAGYVPDERGMCLSKIYILKEFRGLGLSRRLLDRIVDDARARGMGVVHLTVNRGNERSIAVYRSLGFEIVGSGDKPIGDGFFMCDYYMDLKVRDVPPHHRARDV